MRRGLVGARLVTPAGIVAVAIAAVGVGPVSLAGQPGQRPWRNLLEAEAAQKNSIADVTQKR
jgi:hypothetical protein